MKDTLRYFFQASDLRLPCHAFQFQEQDIQDYQRQPHVQEHIPVLLVIVVFGFLLSDLHFCFSCHLQQQDLQYLLVYYCLEGNYYQTDMR